MAEAVEDADHLRACIDDVGERIPLADAAVGPVAGIDPRGPAQAGKVAPGIAVEVDEILLVARLHLEAYDIECSHDSPPGAASNRYENAWNSQVQAAKRYARGPVKAKLHHREKLEGHTSKV